MTNTLEGTALAPPDGNAIRLLMEQIIFCNPRTALEVSTELLELLVNSFGELISGAQIESLLACAAHRAKVDLSRLKDVCVGGGTKSSDGSRRSHLTENEREQTGVEVLRLLKMMMELATHMIGEWLTLRQFHRALMCIQTTVPRPYARSSIMVHRSLKLWKGTPV